MATGRTNAIAGGKKQLKTEIIVFDTEWTVPAGVKSVDVMLFGGGGGGAPYAPTGYFYTGGGVL